MKKFEENLNDNSQISEELKELARQAFSEVFDMLVREGFIKWVKVQTITKDVKSLGFEWGDSEEMKKNARVGVYDSRKNSIRIDKEENSKKELLGTSKHEELHFLTRKGYLQKHCHYLDEGCTEYLKHLSENQEDEYSYQEQVEVVAFFRSLLGDSIIQTYLTGDKKYFLDDLNNVLKEEIKSEEERENIIDEFLDRLDDRHYELMRRKKEFVKLFITGKEDSEESSDVIEEYSEENDEEINKFLQKIILCKFKQMAKAREFNRNGQVDEEFAKSVIKEKLKNARFVGIEYDYFSDKSDISNYIIDVMMDKILYEISENCNSKIKVNTYCEDVKLMCDYGLYSTDEIFSKIFHGKDSMSMITFCDYLIKVSSELGYPPKEMCKIYEVEKIFEILTNNSKRNLAVFNLLAKEITSVESHFRKIGDSEYVEQRDGVFVYLKINDDGTIQEETDLRKVKNIFNIDDTLESIRLVNREDDYKGLGILNESQFQQVEMAHQMIQSIVYQENVNIEDTVKDINIVIQDSTFLSNLVETALKKRTRLQVMKWINTLTREEMKQVLDQIYDEAVINSGIREIKHEQELKEFYDEMYEYEYNNRHRYRKDER